MTEGQGGASEGNAPAEDAPPSSVDRRQGAPDRRRASPGPWQPGSDYWSGAGYNSGAYRAGMTDPQRYGGYYWGGFTRPVGPPWIVGPTADRVLAAVAGFFFNFVGLIGTIVLMYVWAGNSIGPDDAAVRRAHAQSVSIWSGIGCALQFAFFVVMMLAIVAAATHVAAATAAIP